MKISICIPSYNRPVELDCLLKSIDFTDQGKVEVIIREDCSPRRNEIREVVENHKLINKIDINYIENDTNYGYDKNIRSLVLSANGDYIIFMGDDDTFIPGSLALMYEFLLENSHLGYVLKSHEYHFNNGETERFRYFDGDKYFDKGLESYISLFRRSVFISGFTINRKFLNNLETDRFDGGLLYQLYLLAEVAMNHPCAYFDTPLTLANEGGVPFFGNSAAEKDLYTPGTITIQNSLNFLSGFFDITQYIDDKYKISSTEIIKHDMSKYFYPNLAIQRNKGWKKFFYYKRRLDKMGFNTSIYYHIYFFLLLILGKNNCDYLIVKLKNIIGRTPQL